VPAPPAPSATVPFLPTRRPLWRDQLWLASGLGFDVVLCGELEDAGRGGDLRFGRPQNRVLAGRLDGAEGLDVDFAGQPFQLGGIDEPCAVRRGDDDDLSACGLARGDQRGYALGRRGAADHQVQHTAIAIHRIGPSWMSRKFQDRQEITLPARPSAHRHRVVAGYPVVRPVTLRRIRDPSGRQPSEIAPTQVPFAASR
jgi:hypothetical protein